MDKIEALVAEKALGVQAVIPPRAELAREGETEQGWNAGEYCWHNGVLIQIPPGMMMDDDRSLVPEIVY